VAAVQKAGLVDTLSNTQDLTVFAPTNAAFTQLLTALGVTNGLDGLTAEQLGPILKYHVLATRVAGSAATTAAQSNGTVTALGGKIKLSFTNSKIRLDGRANVVTADVPASNGIIHAIDGVILPSIADIATTTTTLSSLTAALTLADTATSTTTWARSPFSRRPMRPSRGS
jgi:transforming growth factor-beta-induced protein